MICERHHYGDKRSQIGELYLPAGDGPFPVAVVIHGGFWRAQYSRKLMRPLCGDLVERGWAAWNLEYRRLGRLSGGGWPTTFDDLDAGIDHLRILQAPLDLTRVVTIGHSAGGHLAALERAWEWRLANGLVRRLLGGTPEEQPDRVAAASPARRGRSAAA